MKRKLLPLLLVLLTGYQFAATAANFTINVSSDVYSPSTLNIQVGDVVTWQWISGDHPTQSDSNPAAWPTFPMNTNSRTFSHTFTAPGTYPYHCTNHGTPTSGMRGVINVTSVTGLGNSKAVEPLLEVYPNPARESIMVKLDAKGSATYRLTLTNIVGQTVSVVSEADFKAGSKDGVKMEVNNLPAGLYFLRLVANDKIMDTRRLILKK